MRKQNKVSYHAQNRKQIKLRLLHFVRMQIFIDTGQLTFKGTESKRMNSCPCRLEV